MEEIKTSQLIAELERRGYFTSLLMDHADIDDILYDINKGRDVEDVIELRHKDKNSVFNRIPFEKIFDDLCEKVEKIILEEFDNVEYHTFDPRD